MVQPSSGDSLDFFCPDSGEWTPIEQMRFEEAKTYRWRTAYPAPFRFLINGMPLPMVSTAYGWEGEWSAPFQSGMLVFTIEQEERKAVETFLYSDKRKLTEDDFQQMITDILEEAATCFQYCAAFSRFDNSGFDRKSFLGTMGLYRSDFSSVAAEFQTNSS